MFFLQVFTVICHIMRCMNLQPGSFFHKYAKSYVLSTWHFVKHDAMYIFNVDTNICLIKPEIS